VWQLGSCSFSELGMALLAESSVGSTTFLGYTFLFLGISLKISLPILHFFKVELYRYLSL
jgi:hypothetical protein